MSPPTQANGHGPLADGHEDKIDWDYFISDSGRKWTPSASQYNLPPLLPLPWAPTLSYRRRKSADPSSLHLFPTFDSRPPWRTKIHFSCSPSLGFRRDSPSTVRGLFHREEIPGMISFLAGKPNPTTFPFSSISVMLKPIVPTAEPETLVVEGENLNESLQYGPTAGLKKLVNWLEDLQVMKHSRKKDGSWGVSIGSGSQDLINKAFHSLVNEGDTVLVETPLYSGTIGLLQPMSCDLVEIPTDAQGINTPVLEDMLANWATLHPNKRFPKIIYTIPTGSNPTGCSSPLERRVHLLKLARQYNLLILEDDAYHYLVFDVTNQPPSYFDLEAQNGGQTGRVLRFDSLSKIISSGMRLGFVSGAKELLRIIDLNTANTNLQPASTTQSIVLVLLERWGHQGFIEHTRRVSAFYKEKRDMFEKAARKHLGGLADWVTPDAGMFVSGWAPFHKGEASVPLADRLVNAVPPQLYLNLHLTSNESSGDSNELISKKALEKGVLAVPGVGFSPSGSISSSVRVSFSLATEEDADKGFARLAEAVREARAAARVVDE
ncbi:BZ3500_MvSof-1268-A1-R1_Chr1-3g01890 [Microbotryum saponariae]|uniref:BZ3500_MvSof-1268-A1-R1_Chr1-3g01890 protein n=1 Tax=Microbotryum saponariae TaxID=289078 RepID=A0A2X0M8F5_9BASI|nr:BZ3500_MvSof-1268-A1-R1_Chr1-3g01890 [Microbotryum saponariae]